MFLDYKMFVERKLEYSLLISIIIHLILAFTLPGFKLIPALKELEYTEVKILPPPKVTPMIIPKPPPKKVVTKPAGGKTDGKIANQTTLKNKETKLEGISKGVDIGKPTIKIKLPKRGEIPESEPEIKISKIEEPSLDSLLPTEMEKKAVSIGEIEAEKEIPNLDKIIKGDKETIGIPPAPTVVTGKEAIGTGAGKGALSTKTAAFYGIEGPVAKRGVIYKPPLPKVDFKVEAEVKLKFWVLSDGTIGSIIPIQKVNPTLEGIAINYVKKYRFSRLEEGSEQQWGTILVEFDIQ